VTDTFHRVGDFFKTTDGFERFSYNTQPISPSQVCLEGFMACFLSNHHGLAVFSFRRFCAWRIYVRFLSTCD
jgi:hypothetical protein